MAKVPYSVPGDRRFDWWWAQQRRKYRREGPVSPYLLFDYPGAAAAYSLRDLNGTDPLVVRVRRSLDNAEQDFSASAIEDGTLEAFCDPTGTKPADHGSGAAAAYSLRVVSDSYTGPVVRVRESVGNTEQDFTAEEITDGTLVAFVGAGNDGFVTTIYDQSGNGNDYTQTTAARQGVLVASGSLNSLNGKPVILRSADDNGGYISAYAPNDGADPKLYFYVGENGQDAATSCIFGSRLEGTDYGYYTSPGSTSTFVNNSVVAANEKLNNSVSSYTNRDEFHQATTNQFLLSAEITFNFTNNEKSLGYRFSDVSSAGMFAFQEEIIYLAGQTTNRTAIEGNINGYYDIYSQTTDGFVTTWYDQSGNGNDATQATAASQPKIVSAGALVTEGGKAALEFDGADDFLTTTVTGMQSFTNLTSFVVNVPALASAADTTTQLLWSFAEGGGTINDLGLSWGVTTGNFTGEYFTMFGISGVNRLGSTTYRHSAGEQILHSTFNLSSGTSHFKNSSQTTLDLAFSGTTSDDSSPSSTGATIDAFHLNSTTGTTGANVADKKQELILYPSDQSSNREAIETNINNHYGIY